MDSKSQPIRTLVSFAKPYSKYYILAVLFFLVKDSPAWLLPLVTSRIVDAVAISRNLVELATYVGIGVALLLQNFPTNMLFVRYSSKATRSLAFDLRDSLSNHLQKLRISSEISSSPAVIQTKLVRDVENVELMIQQSFPIALSAVFSLTGALVLTGLNVPLFLVVFLLVIPIAVFLVVYFRRRSRVQNELFRTKVEEFSTDVSEMSATLPLARAHALEAEAIQKVLGSANELRVRGVALDWLNGKFGALTWVSYQVLGLLSLGLAAYLAITQLSTITPGQVVLVGSYFAVMMGNAIGILNILPVLARGVESLRSIGEVLENSDLENNDGKTILANFKGDIRATNLSAGYADSTVLKGINLHILPGQAIALVGKSGSGKSTLAYTLLGLLPPLAGQLELSGVPIGELDLRSVRRRVSLISQEPVVMNATVAQNVAFGLELNRAEVSRCLQMSNLDELASDENLDLRLGVGGKQLSVGQRQRLAFARAIYRKPSLLLLDEPTAALDTESEAQLEAALRSVKGEMTVVVIAHRLNTVKNADCIYVLDNRSVAEFGTHDELMQAKGGYYRLYQKGNN